MLAYHGQMNNVRNSLVKNRILGLYLKQGGDTSPDFNIFYSITSINQLILLEKGQENNLPKCICIFSLKQKAY